MDRRKVRNHYEMEDLFAMFWTAWSVPFRQTRKDFITIYNMRGVEGIFKAIRGER